MIWLLLMCLAVVAMAIAVHAVVLEPQDLRITDLTVAVDDLPPALEGYTIAALSDIHHSPRSRRGPIGRAVRAAIDARPHLVVLLGDYGVSWKLLPHASHGRYRAGMDALGPILRPLAEAPDGIVAVLGNHDHYGHAPDEVRAWLESLGATVLHNASTTVRRGDALLAIGGVPDPTVARIDSDGWCRDVPAGAPCIVLAHHPDAVMQLGGGCRVDLVLSGHTHGGQVTFPLVGAPVRHSRVCGRHTASGWVPNGRARLFVTRGVGTIVPVRLLAPPEVVVVRLTRDASQAATVERRADR